MNLSVFTSNFFILNFAPPCFHYYTSNGLILLFFCINFIYTNESILSFICTVIITFVNIIFLIIGSHFSRLFANSELSYLSLYVFFLFFTSFPTFSAYFLYISNFILFILALLSCSFYITTFNLLWVHTSSTHLRNIPTSTLSRLQVKPTLPSS